MNKRAVAREWKKQKRRQRLIFRLTVVGVCILAVLGMAYIGWDLRSRTYVMTFNGNRIPTGELRLLSVFVDDLMDPSGQALEQLTQFLVV